MAWPCRIPHPVADLAMHLGWASPQAQGPPLTRASFLSRALLFQSQWGRKRGRTHTRSQLQIVPGHQHFLLGPLPLSHTQAPYTHLPRLSLGQQGRGTKHLVNTYCVQST